jgi:hypothetical protein
MTEINMLVGKFGDKVKIDDKIITLQNSYKLIIDDNGNKYYELETNNNKKFKINEVYLLKIINVRIDDCNYYSKWFNKDNKIYSNVNNNTINIVKYLLDKMNDTKFRYSIRSDDIYDYRLENIKFNILNNTITQNNNVNLSLPNNVISTVSRKFIKMTTPPLFYRENEIRIIQEFEGHILTSGPHSGKLNNNYRLVEIINEPDNTKKRYYEMFLGVYNQVEDENTNTNNSNTKFSFIFDVSILPKILKLTINNVIVENPSWFISTNQYICFKISEGNLIYLHRYLMNCKSGDNKTIDHINNNKLDNRLSNLRVATMSEQNMNRPNIVRKNTLNSILNPNNDATIPKIETKSLLFISKKISDGLDYFAIEISSARTRSDEIRDNSSKSRVLTLKEKLCHALYKRYYYVCQFPIIMKEQIDSKTFTTLDEFKLHTESKINEVLGAGISNEPSTEPITYTIDSFLDYLLSKKIPKYVDPRTQSRIQSNAPNAEAPAPASTPSQPTLIPSSQPIQTYTYKSTDKFSFIDNGKVRRDIIIKITKDIKDNIRYSGCGNKKLSEEEKLCYIIMHRYFILIEHENAINLEIHKENINNVNNITINKNTTGKKTLTDLIIDGKIFTHFEDFKTHTEKIIKDILSITSAIEYFPDNLFTIESINTYFINKLNDKRCHKIIPILNTTFPILIT